MKSIATLGFIGYLPACGTVATFITLPLAYLLSYIHFSYQLCIILILHGIGLFIIKKSLPYFSQKDPKQIVFDECIGTLVTFLGIAYNPAIFLIGFILFRLLDIFKLFGISYIEKLPGPYGVLLDDSVAGLFANIMLRYMFL